MYSIDGLMIRRNTITRTSAYPPRQGEKPLFEIVDSSNVQIEGNSDRADSETEPMTNETGKEHQEQ
jgi:hypothetical protein